MNAQRKGILRFAICGAIGIFIFFVPIGGRIVLDHLTGFLFGLFGSSHYAWAGLLFVVGLISTINALRGWAVDNKSPIESTFYFFNIAGFTMVTLMIFGMELPFDFVPSVTVNIGKATLTVLCAAILLPFLLDYGLVDLVGSLVRPAMRKLFKLPGSAAIVCVGTTLGSFSIGILGADRLYKQGKLNQREAALIVTGFSSVSIGFMILFCRLFDMSNIFPFFFVSVVAVTLLTTAILARVPPLSTIPGTTHCEGVEEPKGIGVKGSMRLAIGVASRARPPHDTLARSAKKSIEVVCGLIPAAWFLSILGMTINEVVDVFYWLGSLYAPILKLFGIGEIAVASRAFGLAIVDSVPAVVFASAHDLPMATRYVIAAFPVTTIIFLGGYLACVVSVGIRVKIKHLLVIWLERAVVSLVFLCAIARLVF